VAKLLKGDRIQASTVVAAAPSAVYDVVSDIRRIPEWSPECVRAEWIGPGEFKGWNRRRFGRWSTTAKIVAMEPGRRFAFAVQLGRGDFTRWSYVLEPYPDGCLVTEEFLMCVDLPPLAAAYERLALRVKDRHADLHGNIDQSLRRLRAVIESQQADAFGASVGIGR
jgi:hypothetical protein